MKRILIKYGGNAMLNDQLQKQVVQTLVDLKEDGHQVIVVHGGGPFIAEQLEQAGIISEFIGGHRKTTPEAMVQVEMALKGHVNGKLVSLFNREHSQALGISGKDAQVVLAEQRFHEQKDTDGQTQKISLGQVGDVRKVNTSFLEVILEMGITPIIACLGTDENGNDYNINGDMMAGHIAGALQVDHFLILTDIDGLRRDVEDPATHIEHLTAAEAAGLFGTSIKGGMIPKIESCLIALNTGAREAAIVNGTRPKLILEKLIQHKHVGTTIVA